MEMKYSINPTLLVQNGCGSIEDAYAEFPRSPFFAARADAADVLSGIKALGGQANEATEGRDSEDYSEDELGEVDTGDVEADADDGFDLQANFAYRSW